MDEFGIDGEDDDDSDDSDFELNGGDDALYDSAWDEVDELKYLRDTLNYIQTNNASMAGQLLAGIKEAEKRNKFEALMNGVDNLIAREADVTAKLRELENWKKD